MIKIADFGLSRRIAEVSNSPSNFIRIPYIDPQYLNSQTNDQYQENTKSDVYSVGMLLWEVSSGRQPFEPFEPETLIAEILNGRRETPVPNTPTDYINIYTSNVLSYINQIFV